MRIAFFAFVVTVGLAGCIPQTKEPTPQEQAAAEREKNSPEAKMAGDIPLTIVNRTTVPIGYVLFAPADDINHPGALIHDGKGRFGTKPRGSAIAPGASGTLKVKPHDYYLTAGATLWTNKSEHLFDYKVSVKGPTEIVIWEKDKPSDLPSTTSERFVVQLSRDVMQQRIDDASRKSADEISRPEQPGFTLGPNGPYRAGDPVVVLWNAQPTQWYQAHVASAAKDSVTVMSDATGQTKVVHATPQEIRHRVGGTEPYQPEAPSSPASAAKPSAPANAAATSAPAAKCKPKGAKVGGTYECCSNDARGIGDGWICR